MVLVAGIRGKDDEGDWGEEREDPISQALAAVREY